MNKKTEISMFGHMVNVYAKNPVTCTKTVLLNYALSHSEYVDIVTFGQIKSKNTNFLDFVNNVVFRNATYFRCAPFNVGNCIFFYTRRDFPKVTAADFMTIYNPPFSLEKLALPPAYRFNFALQSRLIKHICSEATYGLDKSIETRRKKMKQKKKDSESEFKQDTLF